MGELSGKASQFETRVELEINVKILMPEFVLPLLERRACTELDECEIVAIDSAGEIDGNAAGTEIVMLPWDLPPETVKRILTLPTVRWVHTVTAGTEHALQALDPKQEVLITNAQGVFDVPIAEMVLTYILVIAKQMREFWAQQEAHAWHMLRLREVALLSVGIVGLGSIGSQIARRCKALGMKVLATRRRPERGSDVADKVLGPTQLPDLLAAAHFVVIAAPLTPETRDLIDHQALRAMRPDAWLINIARGAIVNEAALLEALQAGWIGGAALDVFEEEPLPSDSPLWDLPNVILTPHNAWSTPLLKQREAELFLDNLERYLHDTPLRNIVDPSRGY